MSIDWSLDELPPPTAQKTHHTLLYNSKDSNLGFHGGMSSFRNESIPWTVHEKVI